MPYPNEHAARIKQPSEFIQDSFRRKNIAKGIDIIIGRLKGETSTTTQAYRFKKDVFSSEEAKKWLKDNKITYISFEAASDNKSSADDNIKPANAGNMEDKMTLEELKAQNPALYDQIYNDGHKAGVESHKVSIAKASNILASKDYSDGVKAQAIKVLNGELKSEIFEAVVAFADSQKQEDLNNKAQAETNSQTETPGQHQVVGDASKAVPENEADFLATLDELKKMKG